jgi:polyphosphate glucokinase
MSILVIDIGGSHVKMRVPEADTPRRIDSGPTTTPEAMVVEVRQAIADWSYDRIAIGYPGVIANGRIVQDPKNLGPGWVGFDFAAAFGVPVRLLNDAAMQAYGSYTGGRLLFLGLGTGLGSAMVIDGVIAPMELAHLPYRKERSYEDYLGERGLLARGPERWRSHVWRVVELFRAALQPDDIAIGGGNAKKLDATPPGVRLVPNTNAFLGGFRLWEDPPPPHEDR